MGWPRGNPGPFLGRFCKEAAFFYLVPVGYTLKSPRLEGQGL